MFANSPRKTKTVLSMAAAVLLLHCTPPLRAQTIQIKLVDGKTGRPITNSSITSLRAILYVWPGRESQLTLLLPADEHGVALLRLTAQ